MFPRKFPLETKKAFLAKPEFLCNSKFSLKIPERKMEMIFFRKFIQNGLWARTFQFWHPWRKFRPKKEVFHPMSENGFIVMFFSRKSSFFSKCFSGHTECSFDNSAKTVSPKNRNFSLISQNLRIFGLSQNFFPETFNWLRRIPSWPWRPWNFRQVNMFSAKPWKDIKM